MWTQKFSKGIKNFHDFINNIIMCNSETFAMVGDRAHPPFKVFLPV